MQMPVLLPYLSYSIPELYGIMLETARGILVLTVRAVSYVPFLCCLGAVDCLRGRIGACGWAVRCNPSRRLDARFRPAPPSVCNEPEL